MSTAKAHQPLRQGVHARQRNALYPGLHESSIVETAALDVLIARLQEEERLGSDGAESTAVSEWHAGYLAREELRGDGARMAPRAVAPRAVAPVAYFEADI